MKPKTRKGKPYEAGRTDLGALLDEAEGRPPPRKRIVESDELDLDAAWSKS